MDAKWPLHVSGLRRQLSDLDHGDHACPLHADDEERIAVAATFIRYGLARHERCVYWTTDQSADEVTAALEAAGLPAARMRADHVLCYAAIDFAPGGIVDPERLFALLARDETDAVAAGFHGVRCVGTANWAVQHENVADVMRFEVELNRFLRGRRIVMLCPYDIRQLDAALIHDVIRAHPVVILGTEVYHNPYYEPPELLLAAEPHLPVEFKRRRAEWWIDRLKEYRAVEQARERAEQEVAESEARYRALLANSEDIIAVLDRDHILRWATPSLQRVLGYDPGELIGRRHDGIINPEDRERIAQLMVDLKRLPQWGQLHTHMRKQHRDGSHRSFAATFMNLLDTAPIHGVVVNTRDVTDYVGARDRATSMAARMRAIAEVAAGMLVAQTPDRLQEILVEACSRVISFDALTLALYDAPTHSLDFLPAWDRGAFSIPEVVPVAGTPSERVIRTRETLITGRATDPASPGARPTGTGERSQSVIRTPILSGDVVLGVLAVHSYTPELYSSDDAEVLEAVGSLAASALESIQHRTEKSAAEQRIRFQAHLLDEVGEAVIATDTDRRILFWNRFAESLFGWSATEVIGRSIDDVLGAGTLEHERRIELVRSVNQTFAGEVMLTRKDGSTFPGMLTLSPIHDEAGERIGDVGLSLDLSDRKLLEEQLRQAQKMEAIGRLAGGIAHDFNNLLVAMGGYAQLALDELEAEHPARDDIVEITRSVERATALTRQLLAFSRRQVLRPQRVSLSAVVQDTRKLLERLIGADVAFEVTVTAQPCPVLVDPGQIEQVVVNLAVNARDAMPRGGRLDVRVEHVRVTADEAAAGRIPPGEYTLLSVQDTGEGMDEATRARIFEPFFTTKETGKGTGLGLSTVYGIVTQSGGVIDVHSEPGEGTRFDLYFPCVR